MARVIDTMHLGGDRVIGAREADGVVFDPGSASTLGMLLVHVQAAPPEPLWPGRELYRRTGAERREAAAT